MGVGRPLIDAHHLGLGATGNETWSAGVVSALEDSGGGVDYAVTDAGRPLLPSSVGPERTVRVSRHSAVRLALDLPKALHTRQPAAVLAHYTLPPACHRAVLVVHDLSFEDARAEQWIPRPSLLRYRASIRRSVGRASVVLTPSEHARGEVLRHYGLSPERVIAVHNGIDPAVLEELHRIPVARPQQPVVLCVGTILPRKNLTVVATAVARLRAGGIPVRLRLVGPQRPAGATLLAAVRRALPDEALEVWGAVSTRQLVEAYRTSTVLAFPSLYEGFGLPVAEAMAAGLPVVTSTATCLPEIAGDAALTAAPDDPDAWELQLRRVLVDDHVATDLARRGLDRSRSFDWSRTATVVRDALALAGGG